MPIQPRDSAILNTTGQVHQPARYIKRSAYPRSAKILLNRCCTACTRGWSTNLIERYPAVGTLAYAEHSGKLEALAEAARRWSWWRRFFRRDIYGPRAAEDRSLSRPNVAAAGFSGNAHQETARTCSVGRI